MSTSAFGVTHEVSKGKHGSDEPNAKDGLHLPKHSAGLSAAKKASPVPVGAAVRAGLRATKVGA